MFNLYEGVNIPLGDSVHTWGPSSSLGTNFIPGGKLMLLKIGSATEETGAMGCEIESRQGIG
jgi:hypothetical protein